MVGRNQRILGLVLGAIPVLAGCADRPDLDGDRRALLALHEVVLDAHRRGDVDTWLAAESADYLSANRGEITYPDKAERRQQRAPYLEATTFDRYQDLVPPIARVSADGSLGWVVVQVGVEGRRRLPDGTEEPVSFVAAWIELYEKRDGAFVMIGNVSNMKP